MKSDLIFFRLSGSRSRNLAVEGSDTDYFGITVHSQVDVVFESDYQMVGLEYFCDGLIEGNPLHTECLFVEDDYYCSSVWSLLAQHPEKIISKKTTERYLKYLNIFTRTSSSHGDLISSKLFFHAMRIAQDVYQLCTGGKITVKRDAESRSQLMDFRNGKMSKRQALDWIDQKVSISKTMQPQRIVPDREFVTSWKEAAKDHFCDR